MTTDDAEPTPEDEGYEELFARCDGSEPIAYLWDGDEVAGTEIARFGWGSEASITSGAGGHVLTVVRRGEAVSIPLGDETEFGPEAAGLRFPNTDFGLAGAIAWWVHRCERGAEGAAAIALEEFDPQSVLSPEAFEEWRTAIDALSGGYGETVWMEFAVTDGVKVALRSALAAPDSTYTRIRGALRDPIAGSWLRTSLVDGEIEVLN